MITSLIEFLELPNFFESSDTFLLMMSQTNIMVPYHIFQNTFILRGPREASFADITLEPCLLKKYFKAQKRLK